jgi:hypothetical protein
MIWVVLKAVLLVTGLLIVMASVDLLWRRVFGTCAGGNVGGCGTGCMCVRRVQDDGSGSEQDAPIVLGTRRPVDGDNASH